MIDTGVGTANYADFVLEFLAKQLGEERPPLLVINTHCHFDHVGGNAGLAEVAEAIAASGHDRAFTDAALDAERDASLAIEYGCVELAPYSVSRWLQHEERIALGDGDDDHLIVLHTPGHTPDSLCLWLERDRILFCGDTIYPHAAIILSNASVCGSSEYSALFSTLT